MNILKEDEVQYTSGMEPTLWDLKTKNDKNHGINAKR